MGGPHVALVDDFSAMFANPASLVAGESSFSAGRLDIGVAGPVFDIANVFLEGGDMSNLLPTIQSLLAASSYKLFTSADVSGPIAAGYKGDGLGFGIFTKTHFDLDVASISSIDVSVSEDVLVMGGYALRIDLGKSNALDLGLMAKGFVRGSMGLSGGIVDLMGLVSDPMAILDGPFTLTSGVGIDVGMRWNWAERISIGIACRDAYTPALVTTYANLTDFTGNATPTSAIPGLVEPNLSAGFVLKPRLGRLSRLLDGLVIAGDYERFLDLFKPVSRNAILNVKLGLELRVLEVLTIRVGMREALLQAGVDFDLGFVRINASAWGDELGFEPGQRSIYNLLLGFDFVY